MGGGKGLTVCLCKRPHEGERVAGQLSHNTLATAPADNGTEPTMKKLFAFPRGPLLKTEHCDYECASIL